MLKYKQKMFYHTHIISFIKLRSELHLYPTIQKLLLSTLKILGNQNKNVLTILIS